jgi:hypothetical protein
MSEATGRLTGQVVHGHVVSGVCEARAERGTQARVTTIGEGIIAVIAEQHVGEQARMAPDWQF